MHPHNVKLAVEYHVVNLRQDVWTSALHVLNLSSVEAGDSVLIVVHALDVVMRTLSAERRDVDIVMLSDQEFDICK